MSNAEMFNKVFGIYATELWAKPEKEFLEWLNAETATTVCISLPPVLNSDDYISRQAAIMAVLFGPLGSTTIYGRTEQGMAAQKETMQAIRMLPSADVQPVRHGRWEYVDYGGFGNWHCTACRNICICNGDYDFCPNCGAKMGEGDEE